MRDGTMFKDLIQYKERDFFEKNGRILFETLYEEAEWEVFSVYVTGTDFNYIRTVFHTPDEFIHFLQEIKERSLHASGLELTERDQILTLSTCTNDHRDARFVVHARRI